MFQPNWVVRGQLSLGSAPLYVHHLQILYSLRITSIFALCSEVEAPVPFGLSRRFQFHRLILLDHKSRLVPTPIQIQHAYLLLEQLLQSGSVYVHCQAGIERSPLVCMAWLMVVRRLPFLDAFAYLKSVHPTTGPLLDQLSSLRLWYQTYHFNPGSTAETPP
jgi:protein-tyrosine phosphatase